MNTKEIPIRIFRILYTLNPYTVTYTATQIFTAARVLLFVVRTLQYFLALPRYCTVCRPSRWYCIHRSSTVSVLFQYCFGTVLVPFWYRFGTVLVLFWYCTVL